MANYRTCGVITSCHHTMDLEAHSYEVYMRPYMYNFTGNLCDLRKNLLWILYVLHMKFIWTSYEFHMKWNQFVSYEIHKKFIWTSCGVQMNFSWISCEIKSNLFIWIYMQFVWNSFELHIEEVMKLIWYTHVLQTSWCEAHKQFAWGGDKMFRTTFSNAFSWMKMYEFRLRFHWCLILSVQLTIFQHLFR